MYSRKSVLNAMLLMVMVITLVAPVKAQTPTPPTSPMLLEVGDTNLPVPLVDKVPGIETALSLPTIIDPIDSSRHESTSRGNIPSPTSQFISGLNGQNSKDFSQIFYAVADSWQYPLSTCTIVFGFGPPNWSGSYDGYHLADDLAAQYGDPVYAVANGRKVGPTISGYGGHGSAILIEHTLLDGSRVVSLYGHINPLAIDEVSKGQQIGTVAWDHLHYGIRKGAYQASASCPGWASPNWPYAGYTQCTKCTAFGSCTACTPSDTICPDYHYNLWWSPVEFIAANGSGGSSCPAPSLSNPPVDYPSPSETVTFAWNPVSCDGQNGYYLRVGTSSGGSDVVSNYSSLGLQTDYTFGSQWFNRDLYWSVRANANNASWSESRRFRIEPNQGGGCSGCSSYVNSFTFNPDSPSNATSVNINVNINSSFPNFRAARIRVIDGEHLGESTAFSFSRTWDTRNTPNGDHCVVLEIDDTIGSSWENPATCYHPYHLDPRPTPPPSTPNLVSPSNGSTHAYNTPITLDWQSSSGATEYTVHLWSTSGYDQYWTETVTAWAVGQLSPATYHWQVRARNQYGESPYSSEWTFTIQQGAPNAPSNLSTVTVSQNQINLTWTDNSSNETGFRLYREGLLAATLGAGTTSYQDTNLQCGRGYNYYIVAFNAVGESSHSNTTSATTQACPPTAPPAPNLISPSNGATFNCGDTLTLVWENLGAGVEYYIETWGSNTAAYGWQTDNTRYLGQQQSGQTEWHVWARYVGQTAESNWGGAFSFSVNSCPQYPDLRPYAPPGYQYPVVPSSVQNTTQESVLFVGQPTYFDWHFINEGNAVAPGTFYVELLVDDYRILRYLQDDFDIGQIGGWSDWAHTVTIPGWHTVHLITDPDDTVGESNEDNNVWSQSFYWHVPCADPYESNNQPATATGIQYGSTVVGADICPRGEYDYYMFSGSAGDTIVADIDARDIGSQLDSVLTLFDSDSTTVLAENDDYNGYYDSLIRYTLSHTGIYYLRVRDYGNYDGGGDHFYQLSLSGASSAPYTNDFESNIAGWTTQGLWHLVDQYSPYPEAYSGTRSFWYGRDSTGNYNTGAANSGSLTSPALYVPNSGYYLRFNYLYMTETQGENYDRRCVQLSVDGGPYTTIHCLSDDGMGWWHSSPALDLSAYADHIVRVRFHFDTVDEFYNDFAGWYIDDISVTDVPPPICSHIGEPNDTPATALAIAYGETMNGLICQGDRDFYSFTGAAGDTIIADIDARVLGNNVQLDSVLTLLASDGVTELATNDDAAGSLDSLLGYTLPESGVYYLKVRDYRHPSVGGFYYLYKLSLYVDNLPPTGAFVTPSSGDLITDDGVISIETQASDTGSGVRNVVFLWHSGDWSDPNWEVLGEDWDGSDGWSINWNVGNLPDQRDAALYAWAFDWGGNWIGMECWGLTLDREPPTSVVETYPAYGGASFRDFWLSWYGEDTASGIATYDIQYRVGTTGAWTDFIINTTDTYARVAAADGYTLHFRSRAHDYAGNVGTYPETPQSSYTVAVCPVAADTWESDNTSATAKSIVVNGSVQNHNFHVEEDQDWVKFAAVQGQSYTIETGNTGGYADTVLYLYGPDGTTLLDVNDDAEELGWASRIVWKAPTNGTYYIKVVHWDQFAYGCSTTYTLALRQGYKVFLPLTLRSN